MFFTWDVQVRETAHSYGDCVQCHKCRTARPNKASRPELSVDDQIALDRMHREGLGGDAGVEYKIGPDGNFVKCRAGGGQV